MPLEMRRMGHLACRLEKRYSLDSCHRVRHSRARRRATLARERAPLSIARVTLKDQRVRAGRVERGGDVSRRLMQGAAT
jgi:hypothetical protein